VRMPKRDDPQYIEIENFEEYELTNCIAYEMVIRNDEFIETKSKLYQMRKEHDDLAFLCLENDQKEFNKIYKNNRFYISREEENNTYMRAFYLYLKSDERYKAEYCKKWKKIADSLSAKMPKTEENFGLILINQIDENYKIKRTKHFNGTIGSYVYGIEKETGNRKMLYDDHRHRINGIKSEDDIRDSESFSHLNMARPLLKFPNIKNTHIKLNLALPPKELSAYILEIKRLYDLDQTIIATANEIFGNKNIIDNDTKDILVNGYARADMFYIYDCLKLGYTQRKIQNEAYNYYQDIGENSRTLSDLALRNYRDTAKTMIDGKGFKELITGFKN